MPMSRALFMVSKPGNIMMDVDGEPHLLDFGLAKRDTTEVTLTIEGRILGTLAHMSPEQPKGKATPLIGGLMSIHWALYCFNC